VLESRWLRRLSPGVIALIAVASIASTTLGAGQRRWDPPPCGEEAGTPTEAALAAAPTDLSAVRLEAWFRLDPRLDRRGALEGQRLALGIDGERSSWVIDLPAESFAAGPFGRIVLVGTNDEANSRLEAVSVVDNCSWPVATEAAVIRRATIDPAGATVYEMLVDRETRADLGIWARPLDGSRPAVQVLGPIVPDERFGRTYTTEFAWDLTGPALAISSCGEAACRTRVLDPATGAVQAVAEPDLGSFIGLAGDVLVSYGACPGLPCPIVATGLGTGNRTILTDAGVSAVAVASPDGPRLVHEVVVDTGLELRSVGFDGSSLGSLGPLDNDVRLQPSATVSESGTRVPAGWVVLGPDGRLPDTGPDAETQLRRISDGTTVQLDEVVQ